MSIQLTFKKKYVVKLLRNLSMALLFISITACTLFHGPEYQRAADTPSKAQWSNGKAIDVTAEEVIRQDWWTEFEDDYLNWLIEQSIAANYNFKIASANLKKAGIAVDIRQLAMLPTLRGSLSNTGLGGQGNFGEKADIINNSGGNTLNLSLTWEVDLWGKRQKGVDATKATYKASEAEWRGTYIKLAADVATKYFEIRQFDQQLLANQRSLRQSVSTASIYRQQLAEGLVSQTEVMKQDSEVNGRTRDLLDLQRQRENAENALSTFLGIPAGEFNVPETATKKQLRAPDVPIGLPSDLLARRPDLIKAEYEVLSSHYLQDISKLDLLPNLTMTASGGLTNQLISKAVGAYTFDMAPSIDFPFLDQNKWKNLESTEADQIIAVATYQNAIMQAFAEVERILTNLHSRKEQRVQLQSQVDKLTIIKATVLARLKEGLVSQLDVLEADRSLVSTELSLLNMNQQILTDTVTLYKALGGGWPVEHVKSTAEIQVQ